MALRQRHFIDIHKGTNGPVVLGLIAFYGAWDNAAAWVYLALHGTYGLLWVLKSFIFPDKQWEQPTGLPYGLLIWFGLSLYWVNPWLICSGLVPAPPVWHLAVCVAVYAVGVFLHFSADMQKHASLKYRPGVLLTDGLWSRLRNPNYLGELLIYLAFCLMPLHWATPLILVAFVATVWIPNMLKKDRSLARYPEFAAWKARSWRLIPFVW